MELKNTNLLELVIQDLEDMKAKDISKLDVKRMTAIADSMVVATGTSTTHVNAIAEHLKKEMKQRGVSINSDSNKDGQWMLIDLGDVVVHIMLQETREFYSLEKLWEDFAQTKVG